MKRTRKRKMTIEREPVDIRTHAVPLIERIIERNMLGYRVKVRGEWFEISVTPCEPPDTYSDLLDAKI